MIDINLIPPALRKGAGGTNTVAINIPKEALWGIFGGLALVLVLVHLTLGVVQLVEYYRSSSGNAQWQNVLPDKNALDAIDSESKGLKKRAAMISDITTKREVVWAQKFNAISDALPRGLWLRKMTLEKDSLLMEGSVVSKNQDEIADVGLFLSTLKQNEAFMKDFSSLEVNSIQRGKRSSIEVADFTVLAKLNDTSAGGKQKPK